jgi:archaellum component FlaF (FlaF/FlaG flagellin family)
MREFVISIIVWFAAVYVAQAQVFESCANKNQTYLFQGKIKCEISKEKAKN